MDKNILVVDDDPLVRRMLKQYLTSAGYNLLSAKNGKEAFDLLRNNDVQLIITDWVMPQMNGLELCRAVRSFEGIGIVYIIILAAQSDKELIIKGFDAGADDYLSKPFHRGELLARVKAGMRIIELEADLEKKNRQVLKVNAEMAVLNSKLQEMATTDELTGLANRREAWTQLSNLWTTSVRYDHPLSCLMIDLDNFKSINDFYGHGAGDHVLKKTAKLLRKVTRGGDIVSRIGGEEFLIICPHTIAKKAANLAERLRKAVESSVIKQKDCELRITISIGIAERTLIMSNYDQLLVAADKELYAAKNSGRNKVCIAPCQTSNDISSETPARETSQKDGVENVQS